MQPTQDLERFLLPYPESVRQLALDLRLRLGELLMPANELVYDAMSAVCVGFLYTEKVRDCFVNLAVYSDHVTLIFQQGARLDDPDGRLKGAGNQVRHLRLPTLESLADPYVQGLILQASDQAPKVTPLGAPRLIVKVMNGARRRPKPRP
jgi:hypothetical protein